MTALELFSNLIKIDLSKFSNREIHLLEAELFSRACNELREIFRVQFKSYFSLMKFTAEKENTMLETNFLRLVIKDILSTQEYDLSGIAYYTDTPEDVLYEVFDGRNTNPSATLLRRSIELHRSVRRDLYQEVINKIKMALLTS